MYERIVEQVAGRFGFSPEKAKQLLGLLIGLIFNEKRGGPAGFIQAFKDKGLGDLVGSWLGHGPNQPITPQQLEGVLGADTLAGIGNRLGLPQATISSAAAAILPDAVDSLSEHGDLPAVGGIPEKVKGWFGNLGNVFDDIGNWGSGVAGAGVAAVGAGAHKLGELGGDAVDVVGAGAHKAADLGREGVAAVGAGAHKAADLGREGVAAVGAGLHKAGDAVGDGARAVKSGTGKLLPWLLIAAAVLLAFWLLRGCKHEEAAVPAVTAPATTETPAATPAAQFDARLALTRTGDKVAYDGVVDSEATKTSIIDALNNAYGTGNVSGNITVDPNARTPGWLASLTGFLPQFTHSGATLTFEGNKIDLSGDLAEGERGGLLDKLKAAFGGFSFGGLFEGLGQAVERSAEAAKAALDKLTPGSSYSADDLVKALNLMIVHFDTGSANISAKSDEILKKSAEAIKNAPAGTKIEVGGHTDNTGNAAANMTLSKARADAVKARLERDGVGVDVLSAKGYGQDKPVDDNASDEGRAQNRRIEFTVTP